MYLPTECGEPQNPDQQNKVENCKNTLEGATFSSSHEGYPGVLAEPGERGVNISDVDVSSRSCKHKDTNRDLQGMVLICALSSNEYLTCGNVVYAKWTCLGRAVKQWITFPDKKKVHCLRVVNTPENASNPLFCHILVHFRSTVCKDRRYHLRGAQSGKICKNAGEKNPRSKLRVFPGKFAQKCKGNKLWTVSGSINVQKFHRKISKNAWKTAGWSCGRFWKFPEYLRKARIQDGRKQCMLMQKSALFLPPTNPRK